MDGTDRTVDAGPSLGERSAAELRLDPTRVEAARRILPTAERPGLDRLAELAARLLGTSGSQVSLLLDVQLVAAGTGAAAVGTTGPLEESLCTVTAALPAGEALVVPDARADERVRDLPPVRAGVVGSYLGTVLSDSAGTPVGALCVFDPEPRPWASSEIATLRQLAASVMTELQLAALLRRSEDDRIRWELATGAGGVGTWDWDQSTGELAWDEQLIAMFGYGSDDFGRTIDAFNARLHPEDAEWVGEALQQAVDTGGEYDATYRIVRPDDETRWIHARGRALVDGEGRTTRILGTAYDVTGEREEASLVTRVLEAMPAGFYSLDRDWRFTYVNAVAEKLLQTTRDELLGRELWEAFPDAVNSVFEDRYREAVRTGEPVAFDAYYPAPLDGWYELRAWPSPDGLSVYFLEVTERRRVQEEAERVAQRLALLASVSAGLAGPLDQHGAMQHLPQLVVPALADFCIVTIVDGDGRARDVGSWHADPELRPVLERYTEVRLDTMPPDSPAAVSLRTGEQRRSLGSAVLDMLPPGESRDLLTRLDPREAVVLPMRGRNRTLGLLTVYYSRATPTRAEDLVTAQEVADRAGLALDNGRLYNAQQQLAEGLQRSLLTEPPEPDHAEIAVRYLPAAEAARVGGDWYDAFLQPGGATMLVIGDVVGHDTEAAAAMGQLRGLLRGVATYSDAGPGEVLRGLDASMTTLQITTMATAAVARLEQTPDEVQQGVTRLRWANAGHLPPLILTPAGQVAELGEWTGDLLLGVDPGTQRRESVATLERGSTVILYTDGLVERRDSDLDEGIQRLRSAVVELADLPLEDLLDELLDRLVHGHPEDDVALVAVRLHRQDRPRPPEAGPARVPPTVPRDPAQG
ncbi:PAS domain-containing protein [Blastococcus sp. MG754426]|uniref:SpoIIE family protein phosphatase n=1 Tax=unclassified Blastococcus TaxID=2619396 RepID=UPI001EF11952|nr:MULTISPECIES: SpoIIE family protein phosphatase [unclassified Blastococcus]MCF6506787.1 PAS domain-containing protein [Blastococcus sp. MG754426]MCF6511358.1 PAS domain-containing protein [Blastococcus sp. MG754427]